MGLRCIQILVFLFCFSGLATGQISGKNPDKIITVTGKVITPDKKPVAGAVFYIDNVRTSYISKSNGSFKLKISPSATKLMVRSSVYGSAEIKFNGQKSISFNLPGSSDGQTLQGEVMDPDSIVYEAGRKPARQRGKKMNTYNDIYQMIRGEVSGVVVSGKSIQIQQGHSFFGSSEPLYVVNGVIVNSIDFVSPLEVKSIKILKGSAASIYGLRGTNGVISITLLNGSEIEK